MAKKIVWTNNALQDRFQILDYWFQTIGDKKYSTYLDNAFIETASNISQFVEIGRIYKNTLFRFVVKDNYLLFYKFDDTTIFIIGIFDGRRNPKILKSILK